MPERYWDREREWDRGRRYRGEGVAPEVPGGREREYGRRDEERGFLDRAGDEVRSWFGDEDASRRRRREESEPGRWGGGPEDVDPEWARQWGYLEGRGRGAARRGGYGAGPGYGGEPGYGPPRASWDWGWGAHERFGGPRTDPSRGSFAGRGPRGYQRSDERIREDICERMCDNDELDASDIEILVAGGEVTLQGSVHDRYAKHLAENLAERVSGVREVSNHLRVTPSTRNEDVRPGEPPRFRAA